MWLTGSTPQERKKAKAKKADAEEKGEEEKIFVDDGKGFEVVPMEPVGASAGPGQVAGCGRVFRTFFHHHERQQLRPC